MKMKAQYTKTYGMQQKQFQDEVCSAKSLHDEKRKISNNLTLNLKELGKEKTKPKVSRRKEIIKITYCWWERKLLQPLQKTVWSFLKKLKIELSYDPAIPPLGIYI